MVPGFPKDKVVRLSGQVLATLVRVDPEPVELANQKEGLCYI